MRFASVFMMAVMAVVSVGADEMRTWTSVGGEFTTEAEIVELSKDGTGVTLRKKDGKKIIVAVERLSDEDRSFIQKLQNFTAPESKPTTSAGKSGPLTNGFYSVSRIVDGDTIDVRDARGVVTRVRIIGVDTPETVKPNTPVQPFGLEATAYTKRLISASRSRIRVELDGPTTDQYQRALAHIYVTAQADNTGGKRELLISEEILRSGLGRSMLGFPFSDAMKTRLRAAEAEAKEQRRNLWGSGGDGTL